MHELSCDLMTNAIYENSFPAGVDARDDMTTQVKEILSRPNQPLKP